MGFEHTRRSRRRSVVFAEKFLEHRAEHARRLIYQAAVESLEARTMLSNYTVNSLADDGSGGSISPVTDQPIVTLRYAMQQAAAALDDDTVTIGFSPSLFVAGPAVITLSGSPLEFDGTDGTVEVDGPGANTLSINAGGQSAAIVVDPGSRATINGLTVTGGIPGIQDNGLLELNQSTVSGNIGDAGIQATGVLAIADSTISGNTNTQSGEGGGIECAPYTNLAVSSSTISGNAASYFGGGLYTYGDDGAGGNGNFGNVTITNSTIAGNSSPDAGGIGIFGYAVTVTGSIVAGNDSADDIDGGSVNGTYDLLGTGSEEISTDSSSHNIVGVTDPLLGPLGYYGGPTQTMLLLPGSPAIGAGTQSTDPDGSAIDTDQRGFSTLTTGAPDMGAFQTQPDALVVNTTSDDPVGPGELSLRDAVDLADAIGSNQTVSFQSWLAGNTSAAIDLTGGPIALDDITGTLTIDATGAANAFTVNAPGGGSAFSVVAGSSVVLDSLAVGGVISNSGTLALEGSSINAGLVSQITNANGGQVICEFNQDCTLSDLSIPGVTYGITDGATAQVNSSLTATSNIVIDSGSTLVINSGGSLDSHGSLTVGDDSALNLSGGSLLIDSSLTTGSGSAINLTAGILTVSAAGDLSVNDTTLGA